MIEKLDLQYQALHAPEMVMPQMPQMVANWVLGVIAAVLLLVAIKQSVSRRDWTPLVFFIAGTCAAYTTEALSDLLTHFTHAQVGADPGYTAYARSVPLLVIFIYSLYFGAWYMYAYPRMLAGTMTPRFLWGAYFLSTLGAYLFEVIPIHYGMWAYFEPQPLWFWKGTLPPHFAFLNSFSIIYGVVFMDKLRTVPQPWRYPVMLIAGPIAPIMGHIAVGQPYYWTMNAGLSQTWIHLGGLGAIGTCLLGVWLLIYLAYPPPGARGR